MSKELFWKVLQDYYRAISKKADKIENYYGFEKGISGQELYQTGIKQAENIEKQ